MGPTMIILAAVLALLIPIGIYDILLNVRRVRWQTQARMTAEQQHWQAELQHWQAVQYQLDQIRLATVRQAQGTPTKAPPRPGPPRPGR